MPFFKPRDFHNGLPPRNSKVSVRRSPSDMPAPTDVSSSWVPWFPACLHQSSETSNVCPLKFIMCAESRISWSKSWDFRFRSARAVAISWTRSSLLCSGGREREREKKQSAQHIFKIRTDKVWLSTTTTTKTKERKDGRMEGREHT